MLKHNKEYLLKKGCLITVQDNTMLKPGLGLQLQSKSLITVQDNTMLKPQTSNLKPQTSNLKPQIQASLRTTRRNPKRYFLLSYFYYITSFVLTQLFRIDPDL